MSCIRVHRYAHTPAYPPSSSSVGRIQIVCGYNTYVYTNRTYDGCQEGKLESRPTVTGETGVTVDRDKIEFGMFNPSSI